MTREMAEVLGLKALAWLVGHDDLRGVFLGATGLAQSDLADGAKDPAFLGQVLEFLMMDDAWVVGFCDAEGLAYEDPMQARALLPGGDLPNWT